MSGETVDLEAIEARANAATPGPWEFDGCSLSNWNNATATFQMEWITNGRGEDLNENEIADGAFIAHARTDIPALVAEVRRLREALNEALFYITAGGPARMFGTHEMYDCLIEKSRVDGWRAAVGGEPR